MKKIFLLTIILITGSSAWAAKINNPKCNEVSNISDKFVPQYLAVVDGYSKSGGVTGEEVDIAGIVRNSTMVKQECGKQKAKALRSVQMDLAKSASSASTPATINPVKANCAEFIALSEEYQPVAVFWAAGHDAAGRSIRGGVVDEEFLGRPILTLVEDCKANPKASFYSKAKSWFAKRL
jgi:hypothetical protein